MNRNEHKTHAFNVHQNIDFFCFQPTLITDINHWESIGLVDPVNLNLLIISLFTNLTQDIYI